MAEWYKDGWMNGIRMGGCMNGWWMEDRLIEDGGMGR